MALVDVRGQRRPIDAVILGDEGDQLVARAIDLIARRVELGAIARRQHHRLAGRQPRRQLAHRHVQAARVEVDPLAQLHRRRLVTDSDEQKVHIGISGS